MERKSGKKTGKTKEGKNTELVCSTTTPRGWWGRGEEVGINTRSVALRGRVGGCPRNGARWGVGRHCAKLKEQNKKIHQYEVPEYRGSVKFSMLCNTALDTCSESQL